MKTSLSKKSRGFTIIEVMIVLAIAGLILAVVLLAVPALQRSQRNNARQGDATHYAGIINDYISNHGGTMPTTMPSTSGETFSQLTSASIGTGTGSKTAAVIQTNTSCTNGSPGSAGATSGSFAVVWQYEVNSSTTGTTCIGD